MKEHKKVDVMGKISLYKLALQDLKALKSDIKDLKLKVK